MLKQKTIEVGGGLGLSGEGGVTRETVPPAQAAKQVQKHAHDLHRLSVGEVDVDGLLKPR